jgi:phage antirepressor YoqD-like protein
MNMGELITRDVMTVREVADVLNCHIDTIHNWIDKLFPQIKQNGKTTYLSEEQVTAIKLSMTENPHLRTIPKVKTTLEKQLIISQAMQFQQEMIAELQAENEVMKPKAIAYDKFLAPDKAIPMSQAAKLLGTGRNRLFAALRENKILMSDNTPYQRCAEYFQVIFDTKNINGKEVNFPVTLVTPKGIDYIAKKLHIIPEARA